MRHLRPDEKQWLFSPSTLNNTPSRDDGITLEDELKRRKLAIEYMRSIALRATLIANAAEDPEAVHLRGVMTIGSILLHRIYMRRSFKDFTERLIAPTVLFLASKIEEEPLKLRHIVNACIAKFEPPGTLQWFPTPDNNEQPSREYRHWERDILITEEILLETLTFDMGIEQPWVVLRRSVKGLDSLTSSTLNDGTVPRPGASEQKNGDANGTGEPGKTKITETMVTELGWSLISEILVSPLGILHPAPIIAFTTFALIISLIDRVDVKWAIANASELGERFHLDIQYNETGAEGTDLRQVKECLDQITAFTQTGVIDNGLIRYLVVDPSDQGRRKYPRRFGPDIASDLPTNGIDSHRTTPNASDAQQPLAEDGQSALASRGPVQMEMEGTAQ